MYTATMVTIDILLTVYLVVIPVGIFLYAAFKQRARLLYIGAYSVVVSIIVYTVQNQPKAPNTNIGSQYGTIHLPLWADIMLYIVVVIMPIAAAFLLIRWLGKRRGAMATPPGIGRIDLFLIGATLLIAATMPPLINARNWAESTIPNPSRTINLDLRLIPGALYNVRNQTFHPATMAQIEATEARLGVIFPPALKEMYLANNGGDYAWLYVPKVENPSRYLVDWRPIASQHGGEWEPLEEIRIASELASEHGWGRTPFPPEADNWIVLSRSSPYLIFLEEQDNGLRLGLVDLSQAVSPDNPLYFESFGSFMNAARLRVQ